MPEQAENAALRHAVDELSRAVDGMRRRYGDPPGVRRLVGDVERLRLDAADCESLTPVVAAAAPLEIITDTPYDESLWAGADDEGVGGFHGSRPGSARP